jgi:hypothetical protein
MGTPNKSYELKKITVTYFISFIWLSTLNFVERRHFYFALQLCIFDARYSVTPGTVATLPPLPATPWKGTTGIKFIVLTITLSTRESFSEFLHIVLLDEDRG